MMDSWSLLEQYSVLFWDFDGVIKESTAIKTWAFRELFAEYGSQIQDQVQEYHEAHGGISRAVKIPYFFQEYIGDTITDQQNQEYCERFSKLVVEGVIQSKWVPGVLDYLQDHYHQQKFYIVTGTPKTEIDYIIEQLDIGKYFQVVYGSPKSKIDILEDVLNEFSYSAASCLMIGDATTDYQAAKKNKTSFLLRATEENAQYFSSIECDRVNHFLKSK